MNKRTAVFTLCVLALVFASCPAPYTGTGNNPDPVTGTRVLFVNDNIFPVSIYSDSLRQVKIADAPAIGRSAEIPLELFRN